MAEDSRAIEVQLWECELALLGGADPMRKSAQFAIRTATRAYYLARAAGTDPIDELLDLRGRVQSTAGRCSVDQAIRYLQTDRVLSRDRDLRRQLPSVNARR